MIIGVLKEPSPETRVSLLPEHLATLKKWNVSVVIESNAGAAAFANDDQYVAAGAKVLKREEIVATADVILSINEPQNIQPVNGKILLGIYQPLYNVSLMQDWSQKSLTIFSMDMLPRTTRAQSMDVLSSQANIAGYKAVLTAANLFPKYFPMFMTAAGSIPPGMQLKESN